MVSIFSEGLLDEAVLRHIIAKKTSLEVGVSVTQKGKSYIQQRTPALNQSARGSPIVALVDLDSLTACPATIITDWLRNSPRSANFLLRFAVVEIEAWLLADRRNISDFLFVSEARIPRDVETIQDPKAELISSARHSTNRRVREALVPDGKSGAVVGPNYNSELTRFVSSSWDLDAAALQSQSLARAIARIVELEARLGQ